LELIEGIKITTIEVSGEKFDGVQNLSGRFAHSLEIQ